MDQAFESFFGWFGAAENGSSGSLLWSADPQVQLVITAVLLLAVASLAFIYVPFTLGLLKLGQLCREVAGALADQDSGLAARRVRVDDAMLRSSIAAQWETFLGRWRGAAVSDGGEERAPVRLADVLEESPTLPTGARRSLLPVLPGLFLASGTLGALVAIALAIPSASQVLDLDAELRVVELASSMEMALRTAVWGLILSMAATVGSRWLEGSYERSSERLDQLVSCAYGYLPPAELAGPAAGGDFARLRGELAQMLDARFAVQAGAMRSLREHVADRDSSSQPIDVHALQAVANSIEQAMSEVRDVSQGLSGAAREVDAKLEALRLVSGSLEELASRASGDQEARTSAIALLRELSDGLRASAAELGETLSGAGLAGQRDDQLAEQRTYFESALSGVVDSIGALSERLTAMVEATPSVEDAEVQRELVEASLAERIAGSIEAKLAPIDSQLQELSRHSAGAAESDSQDNAAVASELRELATELRATLSEASTAGEADAAAQRTLIEEGLTGVATTIGERLGPIDDRLERMSQELAATANAEPGQPDFSALTHDLQGVTTELREALARAAAEREGESEAQLALLDEGLTRVTTSVGERFDPISQRIEGMGEQLASLAASVASDSGDQSSQLGSVASDLRGVSEELRKSLEPAHGLMTSLDERARSLLSAVGDLKAHVDRAERTIAELGSGDGAAADVGELAGELKHQIEALTASFDAYREEQSESSKASASPEHEENVRKALEKARKGKASGGKSKPGSETTIMSAPPKRKAKDMPDLEAVRAHADRRSPAAVDPEGSRPAGLSSLLSSKRSSKS